MNSHIFIEYIFIAISIVSLSAEWEPIPNNFFFALNLN